MQDITVSYDVGMASLLGGAAETPSKISSAIYTDSRPCFKQWQLTLDVVKAKDLKVADTFSSDPFVNIELEGCLARTRVRHEGDLITCLNARQSLSYHQCSLPRRPSPVLAFSTRCPLSWKHEHPLAPALSLSGREADDQP